MENKSRVSVLLSMSSFGQKYVSILVSRRDDSSCRYRIFPKRDMRLRYKISGDGFIYVMSRFVVTLKKRVALMNGRQMVESSFGGRIDG